MTHEKRQRFDVDPILEKISPHIPDNEIDLHFPFKNFNIQGRSRAFKTSQLYRIHIVAMIKGIPSFNKMCTELKSRRAIREFCHLKNKKITPSNRILSEFRDYLKPSGFEEISRLITSTFLNTVKLPLVKVAVPDATDMPANCSGFAKKNASALQSVLVPESILQRERLKVKGVKKAAKVLTSSDIKNILYVFG